MALAEKHGAFAVTVTANNQVLVSPKQEKKLKRLKRRTLGETDMEQLRDELVDACAWGKEDRAGALVSRMGEQPRRARALLEAMLKDPDARVRQAAAFGLGELGGTAVPGSWSSSLPLRRRGMITTESPS